VIQQKKAMKEKIGTIGENATGDVRDKSLERRERKTRSRGIQANSGQSSGSPEVLSAGNGGEKNL